MQAVENLSLAIEPGTIFGFLGANGAGKTTTIRMLCGLVRPSGGSANNCRCGCLEGNDMSSRTKFGYVAQRFSLYRDLTVEENMRFFGGACRVPRRESARAYRPPPGPDRPRKRNARAAPAVSPEACGNCSRSRARLVHQPPVLFLDEPTSGLDPVHRQQMWNLLYDLSH